MRKGSNLLVEVINARNEFSLMKSRDGVNNLIPIGLVPAIGLEGISGCMMLR